MTFKANWEKASEQHPLPRETVEKMVRLAYPHQQLIAYEVMEGGCANLNIKIQLAGNLNPLILRIYLRDKAAAYREQKLATLLREMSLVPQTYFMGAMNGYQFAITEFISGITLADLLLSDRPHNLSVLMEQVGRILAKITCYKFPKSGFFDQHLRVTRELDRHDYAHFAKECLEDRRLTSALSLPTISQITKCLEKYSSLFPDKNEHNLVHADFDPANILVQSIEMPWNDSWENSLEGQRGKQREDQWVITGILDWEFSFSGSVLCDIANMLRYAHQMPSAFQEAFLRGLTNSGVYLPENWRLSIHLLNLLSLLDCLKHSDNQKRPKQHGDITNLIEHILCELDPL